MSEKNEINETNETEEIQETESQETEEEKTEEKAAGKYQWIADVFDVLELFTFCAAVIITLFTFAVRITIVQGPSMENTLIQNDILVVAEALYEPKQGDIVVVQNIGLTPAYAQPIVKRVIAVGGQTIDIDFDNWIVTVDGKVVDEPYRKVDDSYRLTSDWAYPITVPEGYVFCMGDNRNHSADSRSWEIGLIDERCVVGHAVFRLFPFNRIGTLN